MNKTVYKLKVPFLKIIQPKIIVKDNKNYIKWFFFIKKTLTPIRSTNTNALFDFKVSIINFEIVINMVDDNHFNGFFDTIIGNIYFVGKRVVK